VLTQDEGEKSTRSGFGPTLREEAFSSKEISRDTGWVGWRVLGPWEKKIYSKIRDARIKL
jgi:hypothetical protein